MSGTNLDPALARRRWRMSADAVTQALRGHAPFLAAAAGEQRGRRASAAEVTDAPMSAARLRWHLSALRLELALIGYERWRRKAYDPQQPRWPAGTPGSIGGQWSGGSGSGSASRARDVRIRLAGPPTGGSGRSRLLVQFPGTTPGQLVRFEIAVTRTEGATAEIHRYEPNWKPRSQHATRPDGIEGAISRAEARANEAETHLDKLRRGIGHNSRSFPEPAPSPSGANLPGRPRLDGPAWTDLYRSAYNAPDLFGNNTWPNGKHTVAVSEIDGKVWFGVNSTGPGYETMDRQEANAWRWTLSEKYSNVMKDVNIGSGPNDAFYHAETTVLLRAARNFEGSLGGRSLDIYVDRDLCSSCRKVLPRLGLELGNPIVRFTGPDGTQLTMWNGVWIKRSGQ